MEFNIDKLKEFVEDFNKVLALSDDDLRDLVRGSIDGKALLHEMINIDQGENDIIEKVQDLLTINHPELISELPESELKDYIDNILNTWTNFMSLSDVIGFYSRKKEVFDYLIDDPKYTDKFLSPFKTLDDPKRFKDSSKLMEMILNYDPITHYASNSGIWLDYMLDTPERTRAAITDDTLKRRLEKRFRSLIMKSLQERTLENFSKILDIAPGAIVFLKDFPGFKSLIEEIDLDNAETLWELIENHRLYDELDNPEVVSKVVEVLRDEIESGSIETYSIEKALGNRLVREEVKDREFFTEYFIDLLDNEESLAHVEGFENIFEALKDNQEFKHRVLQDYKDFSDKSEDAIEESAFIEYWGGDKVFNEANFDPHKDSDDEFDIHVSPVLYEIYRYMIRNDLESIPTSFLTKNGYDKFFEGLSLSDPEYKLIPLKNRKKKHITLEEIKSYMKEFKKFNLEEEGPKSLIHALTKIRHNMRSLNKKTITIDFLNKNGYTKFPGVSEVLEARSNRRYVTFKEIGSYIKLLMKFRNKGYKDILSEIYDNMVSSKKRIIKIDYINEVGYRIFPEIRKIFESRVNDSYITLKEIEGYLSDKEEAVPKETSKVIEDKETEGAYRELVDIIKSSHKVGHSTWTSGIQRLFPKSNNHIMVIYVPEHKIPDYFLSNDHDGYDEYEEYDESDETGILSKYIKNSEHPKIPGGVTIGWVRYTLLKDVTKDREDDRVWVDEIQTDMYSSKIDQDFGKNFNSFIKMDDMGEFILRNFIKFIRGHGYGDIIIPNKDLASSAYRRGKIPSNMYSKIPKKLRFRETKLKNIPHIDNNEKLLVLSCYKGTLSRNFNLLLRRINLWVNSEGVS